MRTEVLHGRNTSSKTCRLNHSYPTKKLAGTPAGVASALHSTIGAARCWSGTWLMSLVGFLGLSNFQPRVLMNGPRETCEPSE